MCLSVAGFKLTFLNIPNVTVNYCILPSSFHLMSVSHVSWGCEDWLKLGSTHSFPIFYVWGFLYFPFFPFLFLILLFQFCIMPCVQCPVSFFCPECQVHLVRSRWHSRVAHQGADLELQSSLPVLYLWGQNVTSEQQSLFYQGNTVSGTLQIILWRNFVIRACLSIGAKYSFQSVTNWLECEWLWVIYNHGKQII